MNYIFNELNFLKENILKKFDLMMNKLTMLLLKSGICFNL
jgi:hypothetical protein